MKKISEILNEYNEVYLLGAKSRTSIALQKEINKLNASFSEIWSEDALSEQEIKQYIVSKVRANSMAIVILALEMRYLVKWIAICDELNVLYLDGYELLYYEVYKKCQALDENKIFERCKTCEASYHSCPVRRKYYDGMKKKVLKHVAFKPGFICNLKCKYCCEFLPYFEKKHRLDFDAEQYMKDLEKLSESVEYIKVLSFSGGDVMLNPGLDKLIDKAVSLPNVGDVYILTNGTYVPANNILDALERNNDKIHIIINDYEINDEAKNIVAELEKRGVRCRRRPNDGWYDLTELRDRNRSVEELKELYKSCSFDWRDNSYYIYVNGVITMRCGVANGILHYLDLYDKCTNSYVDIRRSEIEEIPRLIDKMELMGYVEMCNYCSGCSIEVRSLKPAGIQIGLE